jgi:F0F1-type ATP synthase membrane subunit c/vacuolar-type H+-ATPase subunit K
MATQDVHAPTLGGQGEPCATCGAPLAADQRYCLECGTRRAEARLAFRDILAGNAPPPGAAPPPAPAPSEPPPARAGLAFLAGLLCLLVALGVGVLIGNAGDDSTKAATTPPPQVITVQGAAGGTATTPAAGSSDTSTTGSDSSSSGSASGSGSSKGSGSSSGSSKSSKSTNKSVKNLDSTSGSDYEKKSSKLPKSVGTGGKPPPKDNKPAGAGSDVESIG